MNAGAQQTVSDKLHGLAQAALQYTRARLDLLQHEWRDEQSRLLKLLVRSALFAFGLLTTYQLMAAAIVLIFWDTAWRIHSVLSLAAITAGITAYAWQMLRAVSKPESTLFATSLAEFDKDRLALSQLAGEASRTATESASASTANNVTEPTPRQPTQAAKHQQVRSAATARSTTTRTKNSFNGTASPLPGTST